MKWILIFFFLIPVVSGNIEKPTNQEYSYLLTVDSLDEKEQGFDLKITSVNNRTNETVNTNLLNQKTPFEHQLKSGTHTIVVTQKGKEGYINSKVAGILNGRQMGFASSRSRNAIFTAGPNGLYAVKDLKKE